VAVSRTVRLRIAKGSKDALACSIVPLIEPASPASDPEGAGGDAESAAEDPVPARGDESSAESGEAAKIDAGSEP
jgi:hypothetical protein